MTENVKDIVVEDVKENNEVENDEMEVELKSDDEVIESTLDNADTVEDDGFHSFHCDSEDSTAGCSSNGFDEHFE